MNKRISDLEEAQILINKAIDKIRKAVKGTNKESSVQVYLIGHLDNWANSNFTMDDTIPELINAFMEGKIYEN